MSSETRGFMAALTIEERQSAFIQSLAEGPGGDTAIYARLLGLKPARGRPLNLSAMIEQGLPVKSGRTLADHMGLNVLTLLVDFIGLSDSTARRRVRAAGAFTPDESDRLLRYARIFKLATELMEGNEEHAREWLNTGTDALGGETPMACATTETGARRVEDLIIALEHGMFA